MQAIFRKDWFFIISVAFLLFFVFSFIFKTDNSFDQDLGRHLKLGEIIWNTEQVPKTNLFSYTTPDFVFINHHWLFELLIYIGSQAVGIQGLLVLKILIILISVAIILSLVKKPSLPLLLPISFLFLHLLRERVDLRPEILSYFFTSLTYLILSKFDQTKTKSIFLLPLIQLFWINTHIYFFIGFLVQTIFLVHFFLNKKHSQFKILSIIILISSLISLINPNSFSALIYPLTVFGNYGYTIVENQSMFLLESVNFYDPNFFFAKITIAIIILSIIIALYRQNLKLKNLLLCLSALILVLLHIRSFPYLFLLALPSTIENFGPMKKSKLFFVPLIITTLLIFTEGYFYLSGIYYNSTYRNNQPILQANASGRKALDFVLTQNLQGPIFNNFDIGSYIIYRSFPNTKVFVDGRPEAYPKEFFQQIYIPAQEKEETFKELDKQVNFQTIIFSHTDQTPWAKTFLSFIIKNPDWKIVYLDDFMIVLVKNNTVKEKNLNVIVLNTLKPENYKFNNFLPPLRLGIFLYNNQYIETSESFIKESRILSKNNIYVWW